MFGSLIRGEKQTENTTITDVSKKDTLISEDTNVNKSLESSDVTELERINRTRQQLNEDKDIDTSVRQQVSTVHERTEVDESMKLLESYSGEVINNIMKCGPNLNLEATKNMVRMVLIDESLSRNVDGSQAIVVAGDRNRVRDVRLQNMISLVGDETVHNCVARNLNELITRKENIIKNSSDVTGSNLTGAELSTEGANVVDKSKTAQGTTNTVETDMKKKSQVDSKLDLDSRTTSEQKSIQDTVMDFFQGGGSSLLGGIIGLIIFMMILGVASKYLMPSDPNAPQSDEWTTPQIIGVVVGIILFILVIVWIISFFTSEGFSAASDMEEHRIRVAAPMEYVANEVLFYALTLLLVLAIVYRTTKKSNADVMLGGANVLRLPSLQELILFTASFAAVFTTLYFLRV